DVLPSLPSLVPAARMGKRPSRVVNGRKGPGGGEGGRSDPAPARGARRPERRERSDPALARERGGRKGGVLRSPLRQMGGEAAAKEGRSDPRPAVPRGPPPSGRDLDSRCEGGRGTGAATLRPARFRLPRPWGRPALPRGGPASARPRKRKTPAGPGF